MTNMIGMVIQLAIAPMGLPLSSSISKKKYPLRIVHKRLAVLFIIIVVKLY